MLNVEQSGQKSAQYKVFVNDEYPSSDILLFVRIQAMGDYIGCNLDREI